jgi:tetratricopeptide (TPR) repeat protein
MKSLVFALLGLLLAPVVCAQASLSPPTPAQQKITWAEAAIEAHPDHSQPYNDLAVAYVHRARETADTSYYGKAEAELQKSLHIAPDNLEGQKARTMILLGRKEFSGALELAKSLNKRTPDDVLIYGLVADADMELGNYKDAEVKAQWMLDLRPANVPGLLRGARLRRLFGDAEGAMDFFSQAYRQTPPTQVQDQAWILTEMADLQLSIGNADSAEKLLHSALEEFPGYFLSLEALARVQTAKQHDSEAVELLRRRNKNFSTAASRYALAEALERAGLRIEADAAFAEFEQDARRVIDAADNANPELIRYYLGRGHNPKEALRIAAIERERQDDVYTQDAYAWALYANGQFPQAQKEIEAALGIGIREATIFYHAGAIAEKSHDRVAATRYLQESLGLNPSAELAGAAREVLDRLTPPSAASRNSHWPAE